MTNEAVSPNQTSPAGVKVMIKPPRLFLFSIVAGLVLQLIWPLALGGSGWLIWLGLSLISGGLGIMFWGDGEFKRWQTAVNPDYTTTYLVQSGPYRFSRNPMYLAFVIIQLGVGLAVNSWWLLLTLLPAWVILRWGVIAREENHLAKLFGQGYVEYQTAVRRWL
ncbi:MAG: isoprenylcysteine carboxylmethyltransferase family protein [Chloroflexi bacterium]|nr:isoprenylcysteine carboxylmethyltransferase family protein [Chloroflexota bacterium]